MKVVFLGTPEFAVPTLDALVAAGHDVLEVVTQPDRPQGRKQVIVPSPVKAAALRHNLPVWQPERIRHADCVERLKTLAPDAMVIVGYGQIIPQSIIDIAPIINVHASLLPELRGAAPIQWSVARGSRTTGVTTMRIDAGLDTGDTALRWETAIEANETAPELSPRLARNGARILIETLAQMQAGMAQFTPQDESKATWAPILKKTDGVIDWTLPAKTIHNLIRGLQPWPGAHTTFRGRSLHLWRARVSDIRWDLPPGALVQDDGVFAIAGDGAALEILELQLEGSKRMPAGTFANGHRITTTEQLGQ